MADITYFIIFVVRPEYYPKTKISNTCLQLCNTDHNAQLNERR
ncbi:hypothetical protein [Vibrio gallaecicus]|nr:hypothetical protein [Vibrio gallaecicus]MDN3613422.1 hypothetical protein [Vibrio gallaecicus]